ncbi:acyl-CoA dehydrogenase [Bordetella petrii]|nr:acyl-CoA dehydrogenase [Bordetella petrii]
MTDVDPAETARAFQDSAGAFLAAASPMSRLRALRGTRPGYERAVWTQLAESGWTGLRIPESLGGLGMGMREVFAIVGEIGRHPLPEPFLAGGFMAAAALLPLPSAPRRNALLSDLASGAAVLGLAWQDETGQARPGQSALPAEKDGADVLLTGQKQWVYPDGADGWLVAAAEGDTALLCLVPAGSAGLRVEACERADGGMVLTLGFDRVRVPAENILARGEAARAAVARAIEDTRAAQAAELLGIAQKTYEETLAYLKTRVQFNKPIGANQALQHRMVDALLQIELARAALDEFVAEFGGASEGATAPGAEASYGARCARVKARCGHAALHMARLAIQFHGAIGYTDELDIGLYLKRALHLAAWLGGVRENRLLAAPLSLAPPQAAHDEPQAAVAIAPPETDWNAMPEAEFRRQVRQFVRLNYPERLRNPAKRLHWHDMRDWYLTLSRQGWIAPAWPREHGGMALEPDKLIAFIEEMEAYGVARAPDQGIINIGPVLIKHGTAEQRAYYLPRILSGEHVWCQGYSEPNAGSDLASLRTEAVIDGDDFVVTGQKIWTTLAQDANHIFMLVRTDKTAKKQAGISFLLTELDRPGITVRPIKNIGGEEEFCEVFFDRVRVPRKNLVGDMNQGWTIAKALLDFERLFVGSPNQARYALNQLRLLGDMNGAFGAAPEERSAWRDPAFVERYNEAALDVSDLQALFANYAAIVKHGGTLPPSVSLLKIWASETYSRLAMMCVEAANEPGGNAGSIPWQGVMISPAGRLYNSSITTIYGGSNEIQRNILAKAVLGLPG